MDKWNLIIDVAECENCNNCLLAAKDELVGNEFPGYSAPHAPQGTGVIRIDRKTRGATPMVDAAYLPRMCNHCDDAPCMKAGAPGAVSKRPDGIVLIDPVKAKGRRDLVDACPYGAIVWNEQQQLPQSWFFDAHLLDTGSTAPRCVAVCPTQAIQALKTDDETMARKAREDGLRPLQPDWGTRPRVYYRNLHRFDGCFIGGSVEVARAGQIDCVEGAVVGLYLAHELIAETLTDAFGDFRFDKLGPAHCSYEVQVSHPVHGRARRLAHLASESIYLGAVALGDV